MAVLFIEYPKCTTCKKAKKWLDEHGVEYVDRHIVEDNPAAAELAEWHERSGLPLRRFFNTSGMKYRELGIKAKLDAAEAQREEVLLRHGIRPTAVRMLVLEATERFEGTFSLADLEEATDGIDKSSIFRTLVLFTERHLLHVIEDGSGSAKYCVCRNDHACRLGELHCHFHCEACGKTFCLPGEHVPAVRYPAGFEAREINYLIKGLCPECRAKVWG